MDVKDSEIISVAEQLIALAEQGGAEITKEEFKENNPLLLNLKLIHKACNIFYNVLNEQTNKYKEDDNIEKIILLGTALLFQLRTLITGESLQFVIGGTTSEGILKEGVYSQDEIFSLLGISNLKINFSEAQVQLQHELESLKRLDFASDNLINKWLDILQYAFTDDYTQDIKFEESDGNNYFYKKSKADINVYFKFKTSKDKRRTIRYYYLNNKYPKSRDDLTTMGLFYNKGWLYQWLKMRQKIPIDKTSKTPLLKLMTAKTTVLENVPGIRSGDYGLNQYKFKNAKIISFNNMKDILMGSKKNQYIGIIPSLELMINNFNNMPVQAVKNLIHDFTTKNQNQITRFTNIHYDEILKSLTDKKIYVKI